MVYNAEAAIAVHPDMPHSGNANQIKLWDFKPNSTAECIEDLKQIFLHFFSPPIY